MFMTVITKTLRACRYQVRNRNICAFMFLTIIFPEMQQAATPINMQINLSQAERMIRPRTIPPVPLTCDESGNCF